jgi:hypothetical protein
VENWMSMLASWSEFVLLHVLPIAISQIADWILEWQILLAGIILVAFFHFWSRLILRAAREAAKETVLAETRAFDAGLKLLRRQLESGAEAHKPSVAPPKPVEAPARGEPLPKAEPTQAEAWSDGNAAVDRLRQAIRLALSTLPTSDDSLPPVSLRLYRAAIDGLEDAHLDSGGRGRQDVLDQIRAELGALKQTYPPQSCRVAWQSLVKVNTLAREFYEPAPLTRAEILAEGKRVTP